MGLIELESEEQATEVVQSEPLVLPVGAQTKPHLVREINKVCLLDCRRISGVTEYEPTEFTITAKAGTPISEVNKVLSENRQYLPFDAPFSDSGSTLGGSIAAGINGSSSLRFGGARDFILGIHFVDGLGRLVKAGGKVVKNAAGFDLPKFFVGSYGRFGLLTELTLKVFPQPESYSTLVFSDQISELVKRIKKLILSPIEIDAIDLFDSKLLIRLGGPAKSVETSSQRVESIFGQTPDEKFEKEDDALLWQQARHFSWHTADTHVLIKVICQINDALPLSELGKQSEAKTRFAIGGQVAYFSVESGETAAKLIKQLGSNGYRFLIINGPDISSHPPTFGEFSHKVKKALDPANKFLVIE